MGAFAGSVELLAPLALGRVLNAAAVRTVQGTVALVGSLSIAVEILASKQLAPSLEHAPNWLALLPGTCLLPIIEGSRDRSVAILAGVAWVIGPPVLATVVGGRLLVRGLVVSSGEGSGRRSGTEFGRKSSHVGRGVVGKEFRWVTRDRRAFMMAFLFPAAMMAPQLLLRPGNATWLLSSVHWATVAGFAIACYGFIFSAASVLASEGGALWLLFTCPRPMTRMLLEKVAIWCSVGLIYLGLVAVAAMVHGRSIGDGPLHLAVAAGGVIIFAFIAAGLGALQADPLARANRPLGIGAAYLYMALVGVFGYSLHADSLYSKVVSLAFFSLLALALWQKAQDRIPYLLDPTARRRPSLDVSDAILIVVAFFVAQVLAALALLPADLGASATISAAFAIAGAAVVVGAFATLKRQGVSGLAGATGVVLPGSRGLLAASTSAALALGIGLGGVALRYQHALRRLFPGDAMRVDITPGDARWLVLAIVVSAPLFEEIIFRGFLYRSLRRNWPRWAAALASGGAFAACHPPAAVAPVLALGLLAAVLVEWSGSIVAPVLLHATYNAVVLSGLWDRVLPRP